MVRIDSTVTEALMHEPSDSSLLWDAVRVMTRLLDQAAALPGAPAISWRDHRRLAKKRAPRHPVQPRQRAKGQAVSRADRGHACHPGGAAAGRSCGWPRCAGIDGRALACRRSAIICP